jgi:hypothetical protein
MSGDVLLRQAARVAWAIFSGNRDGATSIDLPLFAESAKATEGS